VNAGRASQALEVGFLLLLALGLPLLVPPAGGLSSLVLVLVNLLLAAIVTGSLRGLGAFGCERLEGPELPREILLAAAVGAAIGTAAANSLDSAEGVGILHGPLSVALSVLFGLAVARERTVAAGVGVVLALASPAFGPAAEELYTDVSVAMATAALFAFQGGARSHPVRGPLVRMVRIGLGVLALSLVLATLAAAAPGPSSLVTFRYLSFLALPALLLDDEELSWPWLAAAPALASGFLALTAVGMALERVASLGFGIGLYHRQWVLGLHPAHTGHWFAALFPLALAAALARGRAARIAGGCAASVILVLVLLSYSRAAWAGAVLGGVCLGGAVLLQQRARARASRTTGLAAAGAGLLILLVLVLQGPARSHLTSMFDTRSVARSGRLADLAIGLRMVSEAPVLGHGPNARRLVGHRFERPGDELPSQYFRETGHNAPLKLAGEAGVLSGLVFAVLLGLGVWMPFGRRAREFSAPGSAVAACGAGIAALVPPFLIGGLLDGPHALFWVLLGASVTLAEQRTSGVSAPESFGGWRRVVGLGCGLLLALWALLPAVIGGELREALRLEQQGRMAEAEIALQRTASRAACLVEPHELLARLQARRQGWDDATASLARAVEAGGGSPALRIRLAGLELRRGRVDQALEILEGMPSSLSSGDALAVRTAALISKRELAAATESLADRLALDPEQGAAGFPRPAIESALGVLERRVRDPQRDPAVRRGEALALGRILEAQGRAARALAVYERLRDERRRDPEVWRRLAAVRGRIEGPAAAVEVLRQALERKLTGVQVGLYLALGRALLALERTAEARPALEVALEDWRDQYLDPYPVLAPLAEARQRAGDQDKAAEARAMAEYLAPRWAEQLGRATKDSSVRPIVEAALEASPAAEQ